MTYKILCGVALLVVGAALTGCASGVQLAPELGMDPGTFQRGPGGILYDDVRVGNGRTAEPGDTVVMHYTGWLADGTRFEATRELGQPLVAEVGPGSRLVKGWNDGVLGMRAGGRRHLVIPPHLAYGRHGLDGVIPSNATLVFDVELLEVR